MTFSLSFVAHSEVGRIRKNNQDAGYASPTMLLVTDGMGGAAAGDLASAVASTEAARSDARSADGDEMLERISGIVARANTKLADLIEEDLELDGMGTTFCGAMFNGTQFGLAHIGDSRGYLMRDGTLTQLTHDHSWVQSLIDEGKITPEQAATHPHRSLILKVLNGQINFEPDLEVFDAKLGDRIMFCSDGLSGLIDDDAIAELMVDDDLEMAVKDLAEAANRAGGHDNITVVLAEVVEQDDDLDAREGVLVGSAVEVEIPRTGALAGAKGLADKEPPYPKTKHDVVVEHDETESARYAPQEPKRRWPGVLASIIAVALVIGGGAWAFQSYSKSRYFVSSDEAHVAIFNGIPGAFLGINLASLEERTDIPVAHLPKFFQDAVRSTIGVSSLDAAQTTVGQLRDLAERCQAVRRDRQKPPSASPSPTASGSPILVETGTASPIAPTGPGLPTAPGVLITPTSSPSSSLTLPTALGTVTPTATEEADPEDC